MKTWPYPKLFAHRGGGALAPENTMAGMHIAAAHRFNAVEFDVKLSADGIAMLMHDDTLERTTNGVGVFKDKTATELEMLDAGSWMASFLHGSTHERIPRFSAVMHFLHTHGMNANIEIKPCPGREVETGRLVAQLTDEIVRAHTVKPLLTSFSIDALRAARHIAPSLPIGLLVEQYAATDEAILDELQCVSLHCAHDYITPDLVKQIHDQGRRLLSYTVNDVARAETLFSFGVDGIFTDQLDAMAKQFPQGLAAH
jgi:glycerophosphoryl diester phosphodiesterase